MKFSCEKNVLAQAVGNVSRAVSLKTTLPILEGILIRAVDGEVQLTGYDLELGITTQVEAEVAQPGEVVLSAKLLGEMLRKAAGDRVYFEVDEKMLTLVRCGNAQYTILGMDAGDYPELPNPADSEQLVLPQAWLKSMIEQTIFAVATNDAKPVHMGALFEVAPESVTVVAVDGYRMAVRREQAKTELETRFVVPGKTLSELSKLLREEDGEEETPAMVQLAVSRKHIVFAIDGYSVVSRLLEGEFLDYAAAIPKSHTTEVEIDTRALMSAVERTALLISDRLKSPLRVRFEENTVKISCATALGRASDEIDCEMSGNSVEIGFNNRYVLDALRAAGCDRLKLQLGGPLSPMKVVPIEGDSFLFLVLPVRLKSE